MIQVKSLAKSFGEAEEFKVLSGVSFEVKAGEVVSVVGPSGCGKTTLLNILAGLQPLSSGLVAFSMPKPQIGFLFQKPALLDWRTVSENIQLPSEIQGKKAVETQIVLERVGLEGFGNFLPSQISGGMQQRAALGRALATSPDILLMDEPFGSLDEYSCEQMELELQRFLQPAKIASILVSHNVEEAVFLSDQVIILSERPATIKKIIPVSLPRPRNLSIKYSTAFQGYVKWIKKILRE